MDARKVAECMCYTSRRDTQKIVIRIGRDEPWLSCLRSRRVSQIARCDLRHEMRAPESSALVDRARS